VGEMPYEHERSRFVTQSRLRRLGPIRFIHTPLPEVQSLGGSEFRPSNRVCTMLEAKV